MENLTDLLVKRRSMRKFTTQTVEAGLLQSILQAALLSPSSKTKNPWEFIVVDDPNRLSQLALCKEQSASFIAQAPLAIVVVADTQKSDVWIEDSSIAAILIQLKAEELGLGSCWVQVRCRESSSGIDSQQYVRQVLGIPADYGVLCVIPIGYKAMERKPFNMEHLASDKIRYNGWE